MHSQTDPAWLAQALRLFDAVLLDHAHCEKKAAASAMALVNAYPENSTLVRRCVGLAQEELRHFKQVHRIIVRRGLALGRDRGDPYAQALLALVRPANNDRFLDRLLVSALIEARSAERLSMLAGGLQDTELSTFYGALAQAEAGHHRLFVDLACASHAPPTVHARLAVLGAAEARIVAGLPLAPRIH